MALDRFLQGVPVRPRRAGTDRRFEVVTAERPDFGRFHLSVTNARAHANYSIAYHFVWIPKYRRRILLGDVQAATKVSIEECCTLHGFTLLALETDEDHVHAFVSAPPKDSPAKIVGLLKGHSSRRIREQFPTLAKRTGKEHLWTSAYYVGTAGAISAETIRRYINECQGK